jgi:hypothetical protein
MNPFASLRRVKRKAFGRVGVRKNQHPFPQTSILRLE